MLSEEGCIFDPAAKEAKWEDLCREEGIKLDKEPEPSTPQNLGNIPSILGQLKQLHKMLKLQCEELALHQENSTDHSQASVLENHQGFMLAVTVLQDSMVEVFGDKAKQEKKCAVDPFTPVYHCNNGNTYCCPQCNY